MTCRTLFLVDDDREFREGLAELLTEDGFIVVQEGNSKVALERLSLYGSVRPDLVLLDIQMPGMDGITFIERLHSVNPRVPVVFCSGKGGMQNDFSVTTNPQVKGFLKKPIPYDQLLEKIAEILGD